MHRTSCYVILVVLLWACSSNDDAGRPITNDLSGLIEAGPVSLGSVIACAAGTTSSEAFIVYLYPRPGVSEIRYFETENTSSDPNNYSNYKEAIINLEPYFNGYLLQIRRQSNQEKWVVITFLEEGVLQVSNPIRIKHLSQNTQFSNEVQINNLSTGMPTFSWSNLEIPSDVIYFQIVSDDAGNLLSGTYTNEMNFQYYNTANVVLNITRETPPELVLGNSYAFTMLAVSEDNWVNTIAEKPFAFE